MTRNLQLLSCLVLSAFFYSTISVFAQTTATTMATLQEAAEAVGAASEAIEGLTDSMRRVNSGKVDYSYDAAKRERDRLISLSARGRVVAQRSQRRVVERIDDYSRLKSPSPEDWEKVRGDVIKALQGVSALLEDVKQERSDFVLEKAYNTLTYSLSARERLLEKLSTLDPPSTPEERQALRELNNKYKRLLQNFHKAIDELNRYIWKQSIMRRKKP
jgi:hypothetical protein